MYINIKTRLKEKGLNRNQFAKAMQIGYPAACALYDGTTSRIDFSTLESICRVLTCTPNDILKPEDEQVKSLFDCYNKLLESNKNSF